MTTRHATTRHPKELKLLCVALWGVLFGIGASVNAQTNKIPRVGYLTALSTSSDAGRTAALRQGLRELAYVDRKNIIFEVHSTGGKADGLSALAAGLVRSQVDIIVTGGPTATRPAKQATLTIPIIMAQDNDPVGNGFVASLARPGGNITGLSSYTTELNASAGGNGARRKRIRGESSIPGSTGSFRS
jgi:putative ABC transport system substrate-binding protein